MLSRGSSNAALGALCTRWPRFKLLVSPFDTKVYWGSMRVCSRSPCSVLVIGERVVLGLSADGYDELRTELVPTAEEPEPLMLELRPKAR